jgi:pimeloyl-ACP methyl ester carboxylesterase
MRGLLPPDRWITCAQIPIANTGVVRLGSPDVSTARIHRDIKASGVRLRVTETGEGPSLVLLHGLFMDHTTWDPVSDELGRQYRVVAPDLPGFGQSEKPPESRFPYGINAFADAVVDLYAGLDLGRAIMVGHALGGAVAITLAARHPELISRLVLIDALCYSAQPGLASRVALAPLIGGFAFKQLWGKSAFKAYFKESYLSRDARIPSARLDGYYESFNTPAARASALATLRATRDTRAVVAHIARITTPTLVIWGSEDTLYPAALGQRMSREIPHAGFQLVGAGHAPHEEQPSEVVQAILRFCAPRTR